MQHFQALLRLDTSNPPGNEKLATDYLQGVFEREGIAARVFALDPNRPNLVARIKGNGSKRPLLLMGHTDVVTVDPKKWTFPPFSATRDGGYVYSRGSLDDKPHVVAGLMILLQLKRLNVPLDRDVIFLAEASEEGSTSGAPPPGIDFMVNQHHGGNRRRILPGRGRCGDADRREGDVCRGPDARKESARDRVDRARDFRPCVDPRSTTTRWSISRLPLRPSAAGARRFA